MKKHDIDMTQGSLLKNIIRFAIPLMLTNILQLLYNAADIIVVGRYAGSNSLAAVGSTSSLINLLIGCFVGLSVGVSVLIGQAYGERDDERMTKIVHTAILSSVFVGIAGSVIGLIFSKPILEIMGTPVDIINKATLYTKIYFIGVFASVVYNFAAAILRSVGDTKRPLYILAFTGIINVILNLVFVINLHMDVAGVATATAIANFLSMIIIFGLLIREKQAYRLIPSKLKIHKQILLNIIKIGIPAAMQGMLFSFSNVLIQSSVNSFGAVFVAGNSAGSSIEGFVYTGMNSIHHACLTAVAQNYGAGNKKRIYKSLYLCVITVTIIGIVLGGITVLLRRPLLGIYSPDPQVVNAGCSRIVGVGLTYFLCGIMEVMVGALRGLGYSVTPTIVSVFGICGIRILWILTVFQVHHTILVLYLAWTVSWLITGIVHYITFLILGKKKIEEIKTKEEIC